MGDPMANDERTLPERRDVKLALQGRPVPGFKMSQRQIDALLRGGWRALVGESKAEADELREALARFQVALKPSESGVG